MRLLTGPINVVFLTKRGMSLSDIALVQFFFAVFACIVSYPCGVLSNFFSPKKAFLCGVFATCLYYILYLGAPCFYFLCLAQCCLGIGLTLISINASLWLIKETGRSDKNEEKFSYYTHLESQVQALGGIAITVFFCIFSLWEEYFSYENIYQFTAFSLFLILLYITTIKENKAAEKKSKVPYEHVPADIIKQSFYFLVISSLIWCAYQPLFHFWQPLFGQTVDRHGTLLGFAFLTMHLFVFLGHKMAHFFSSLQNDFFVAACLSVVTGVLFYVLSIPDINVFLLISIFSTVHGLQSVLWKLARIQCAKHIKEAALGEVLGCAEMLCRFLSAFFLLFIFFHLKTFPCHNLFKICSFIAFFATAFWVFWYGRSRKGSGNMLEQDARPGSV